MKTLVSKASLFTGGLLTVALSVVIASTSLAMPAYAAGKGIGPQALPTVTDAPSPTPIPPTPAPPTEIPPTTAPGTPVPPAPTPTPGSSVPGFSDPYVLKSASSGPFKQGETGTFTIVAGNRGSVAAVNVQVRDSLANYFDLVSVVASPRGTVILNGNSFIVDIGTLNPNELITIVVTVKANANAKAGVCQNIATLNTTSAGEDPTNDIAFANCLMGELFVPETGADLSQGPMAVALLMLGAALLAASIVVGRRQTA